MIRSFPGYPGVTLDRYGHATRLGGIKDALHGNLIIEYEHPGKLSKRAGLDENLGQLQQYLAEEAHRDGQQATAALRRMAPFPSLCLSCQISNFTILALRSSIPAGSASILLAPSPVAPG